ncbi:MAG: PilZ domain-containing protein [candidate division FCPU426 bacterium]
MPHRTERSETMRIEQVFSPHSLLRLIYLDQHRPVQFKARVVGGESGRLELELPEGWWRLRAEGARTQTVRLMRLFQGGLYTQEAVIREERPQGSHLVVELTGELQRSQRRQFYRVPVGTTLQAEEMPARGGTAGEALQMTLEDISAGGAGLVVPVFLAPGNRLRLKKAPALPGGLEAHWPAELEVVWCRVRRPHGFRVGARFVFATDLEQETLARMINRLQLKRRAAYYHVSLDDTWAA